MQENNTTTLPPIKTLFSEAWLTFTKSLLNLFLLYLGTIFATIFMVAVFGAILFFTVGQSFIQAFSNPNNLSSFFATASPLILLFVFLLFLISSIIIGVLSKIVTVLIVGKAHEGFSLGQLIKQGFSFILPLWVTSALLFFLEFGAFFCFVIPLIIFAIFFMFVENEVILGGKKLTSALKGSYQIVSQHFGEIFVRGLVFLLIYIGYYIILSILEKISAQATFLVSLYSIIFNIFIQWFGVCYIITLYKQAKEVTDTQKEVKLLWMWIIAILGWIFSIFAIIGLFNIAKTAITSGFNPLQNPNFKFDQKYSLPNLEDSQLNFDSPTLSPVY